MALTLDALTLTQGTFTLGADTTLPNTTTALIGPSGCGKSTLLAAIAGFLKPSQGRILLGVTRLDTLPPGTRPLSVLFQDNNLFPHLSVAQNVGLGIKPNLRLSPDQHAQVAQTLANLGLNDLATRTPSQLSGGQQSRVALARVLLRRKPLLLLDEPFAALGPALRHEMLDLVAQTAVAENMSVLMVTHDPADALRIAHQTCVIENGQLHPPADTKTLFDNPTPELRRYLGR